MRNLTFSSYPQPAAQPVVFPDHTVFTEHLSKITVGEHISGSALICVLAGALAVRLNRITHKLSPGGFLIVSRGSILEFHASAPCRPFILCFNADVQLESQWKIAERVHAASTGFVTRITELAGLRETCSSFMALRAEAILRSIISNITEFSIHAHEESLRLSLKKKIVREENYKRVAAVRDWMEDHFSEEASLKQLASSAALDPQHFLRLFTQLYSKTPRQYIIERRIGEAKRLLANPDMTIESICYQIGWQSVPTFTLIFKQKTGATPGQFRAGARPGSGNLRLLSHS
jgi:AraC family transcriptional regulator